MKVALSQLPTLALFDPSLPTMLQTYATRLKGLGYTLLQQHGDTWRLVQCGSRFLTDIEKSYAMVELQTLAALWAMKKCHVSNDRPSTRTLLFSFLFDSRLKSRHGATSLRRREPLCLVHHVPLAFGNRDR